MQREKVRGCAHPGFADGEEEAAEGLAGDEGGVGGRGVDAAAR